MFLLVVLSLLIVLSSALNNGFTQPPLGYSALYGAPFSQVNEVNVRGAAQGLVDGGFFAAGYKYVILDDWYAERGPDGKLRGTNSTFPRGVAATSQFIHSLGLKFGVYSAASQRTCANFSSSQWLENLDADTFANDWEIDWLKYDSCLYNNGVASRAKYIAMRDALNATGRQIFYSMEGQAFWPDIGNMWRSGNDIFPKWDEMVLRNLYANNALASIFLPGKGAFNDPDMLQCGSTNELPFEEARSQFALWAIMKAPLILGAHWSELGNMSTVAPHSFSYLTNSEVIAINQDISPAATLRQAMPSALQSSTGIAISLQACDSTAYAQKWIPGSAAGAIQSKFGALCVATNENNTVTAAPCDSSTAGQVWGISKNATLVVVNAGAAAASSSSSCLDGNGNSNSVSVLPCIYTGTTSPPPLFDSSYAAQVWIWDSLDNIIHGASGLCLALGVPNNPSSSTWVTNNGTLAHEVWGGPLSTGKTVAVLFNKSPMNETMSTPWDALGLAAGASFPVRDVLSKQSLPPATSLTADVAAHGVRVFIIG